MIVLLAPAKTLDFTAVDVGEVTQPRLLEQTAQLVEVLLRKSPEQLQDLMSISAGLAQQNSARYAAFDGVDSLASAKPAVLAFKGDVYRGLEADTWSESEIAYSQHHIRILSGLYGMLRPLDLMQPYRLEMSTRLKVGAKKNLYEFWGDEITKLLRADIEATGAKYIINAASKEYMGCLDVGALGVPVIEADFRELREGKLRFITYNAKMARGKLAQLMVRQRINTLDEFQDLDINGYCYNEARSEDGVLSFVKDRGG